MAGMRIEAIRLLARDPAGLAAFLREALGFAGAGPGRLQLGDEFVEIARADGAPYPADIVSNDTRFQHFAVIVSDMDAALRRLRAVAGWTAISTAGPERLPEASGGASAFKFRSPEGHPLELLQFPSGRAPDPWDARPGLHLGIDHSAIGVANTEASIGFYEGLGFAVAARQTNRGAEQGRLDGVGGEPVVEVTALNPPGGAPPHLELLCYLRPSARSSGVAAPDGVAATRLVVWGMKEAREDPDGHRLVEPGFD
ncbi:VOC family protein [Aureimonas leprariae]|uniref:Glyoxalase n=1 Tax=Plantimonas leprariae TaxID=2615207 RepID=A0A7V7TVN2_9HYPH|nr:VOC family protein [Aureimonas leprariae]KAB0678497.1 glyoxalase [Aureimonas leprariae]